jgi:hypothetical protein
VYWNPYCLSHLLLCTESDGAIATREDTKVSNNLPPA